MRRPVRSGALPAQVNCSGSGAAIVGLLHLAREVADQFGTPKQQPEWAKPAQDNGAALLCAPKIRFAGDSLVEGEGFEPSVPRQGQRFFEP
jgi:hypothetical protein